MRAVLQNSPKPITPPRCGARRDAYECDVEHDGRLYTLHWTGSLEYPLLLNFPDIHGCDVFSIVESPNIAILRRQSKLVDFGSHSSIRRDDSQPYPISKLAHPDAESIKLIQYEYKMLRLLASLELPVPAFSGVPIYDGSSIRGYRMEELLKLSHGEMRYRKEDITQAIEAFHKAGYSHGDLSQSNVMKNAQGRIILIDISCSGPAGAMVPPCLPLWAYDGPSFDTQKDLIDLEKFPH